MKSLRRILLSVFGALLVCMDPVAGQTRFDQEILDVLAAYVRATNEGDAGGLAELYLDAPTTGSVGDGAVHRGRGSVADLTDGGWIVAHDHTSTVVGSGQTRSKAVGPGGGPTEPVRRPVPCQVSRIVDGDTIDCAPLGRIRLIGMDTPESNQRPFGDMATEYLGSLIAVGSEVAIEPDVEARDRYGRTLGYVWAEGVMVNWAMVRAGYAVLLTYPPNVQYAEWFQRAQEQAREDGAGLWAVNGFECLPREHRRGVCEGEAPRNSGPPAGAAREALGAERPATAAGVGDS